MDWTQEGLLRPGTSAVPTVDTKATVIGERNAGRQLAADTTTRVALPYITVSLRGGTRGAIRDVARLAAIALQSDQSLWGSAARTHYHHCIDANNGRRDNDGLEELRQPISDTCIAAEGPHNDLHVRSLGDGSPHFDSR